MKGLCRIALAALFVAACGRDGAITEPTAPNAPSSGGGILAIGVDSTTGASIETNKDDYAPGEIVHLVGRGWAAGETVNLHMTEEPNTHADVDTNVVADATGGFSIHFYDVQTHDLGVTFTLTATGQTSGSVAVATFTDGTSNLDIAPAWTSAGAQRFSVLVRVSGGSPNVGCIKLTVPAAYTGVTRVSHSVGTGGTWAHASSPSGNVIRISGTPVLPSGGATAWARIEVDATAPATATSAWAAQVGTTSTGTVDCNGGLSTDNAVVNVGLALPRVFKATFRDGSGNEIAETGTDGVSKTFRLRIANTSGSGGDDARYATIAVPSCWSSPNIVSVTTSSINGAFSATVTDNYIRLLGGQLVKEKNPDEHIQVEFTATPASGVGCSSVFRTTLWKESEHHNTSSDLSQIFSHEGAHPNVSVGAAPPTNVAPTVNAGGAYDGAEGSAISLGGPGGATASDPDAGDVLSYKWTVNTTGIDVGGTCTFSPSDAVLNPSVTCTDDSQGAPDGKFTLTLEVKDGAGGHTVTDNADLTVTNVRPTATSISTVPPSPTFGSTFTVTLNGGNDVSSNDVTEVLQYKFDCGSGYGSYGSTNSTTCTANSPNSQTVKATIKDNDGGENEYQTTISVNNAPPVANAGGNKNGTEGLPVTLNGTGSSDPDGTITTYAWSHTVVTADLGTTCSITNGNLETASITCTDDGSFTVTLTVTDDDGATNSQTVTLSLSNANPTASAGGPYSGAEGAAIALSATGDDPGNNDDPALTYAWSVNSTGIDASGACTLSAANVQSPTVTCTDDSNAGNFTVTVVVSDDDGGSATASANLSVTNANPVANAGGPYSVAEGSSVNLSGSGDDPGNNDDGHLTFLWSVNFSGIDAGGTCTIANPTSASGASVSCTDNGNFSVSLQVSDDDGGSHTSTVNLTVNNAAPTADAGGPYNGSEGSPVALTGSATDPGSNDTHTYAWTYAVTSSDPGATCSFSSASAQNPTVTCTDNGVFTVKLVATDDDGSPSPQATATLTLTNVAPVADAGGPYTGSEGSPVALTGSASDAGSNDSHSYAWTYSVNSADAGTTCNFSSATAQNPTITCTDNGTFTVSLVVTDDDGAPSAQDNATVTLTNANPTSDAGGPYSSSEGSAVAISGSKSDQGANDTHTSAWSYTAGAGVDAGTTCSFADAAALTTSVTCTDDGTFTLTLTITDDDGGEGTSNATLTVSNVAPVITTVNAPIAPVAAGTNNVTVTWNFTDPGTETWTCSIQWDVDQDFESATYVAPKSCSATKTLPQGLYTVTVKVSDNDGGEDSETVVGFTVVYDPNAGFVTGGGWIMSPTNAYFYDLTLTGKANFGFVSKYLPGRTTPDGNTEFQFHAGNLNFKSTVYEWLVVAGTRAQFKGDGTLNGVGGYGFLLTGIDDSPDKFRIKIVRKSDGVVVYDNQRGALEDTPAATALGGGSIVIHTKK